MSSATGIPALQRRSIPLLDGDAYLGWVRDGDVGIAGGACDADPERALLRAEGEYAEHLSQARAAELMVTGGGGGRRIDPRQLCLDTAPATAVRTWVTGRGMVTGDRYDLPAQAVFLGWDPPAGEPKLWFQTSVGTAAHRDPGAAEAAALAEVIERDTLLRGWRTGEISFHDLTPRAGETLPARLLERFARHDVILTVVRVAGVDPDLVLAILSRTDGGNLTCGAALRWSTLDAISHAALEALAVRVALSSPRPPARLEAHHRDRGLLAARNGPAHLRFVAERTAAGSGAGIRDAAEDPAVLTALAQNRFGHEPIMFALPDACGHVVRRVVCPGSEVFESTRPGGDLPCPIA